MQNDSASPSPSCSRPPSSAWKGFASGKPHIPQPRRSIFTPRSLSSLLGMVFSFLAGLLALQWLSRWLETGRWYLFGIYCLVASGAVFYLHARGF